jgi:hypothetical protein
MREARAPREAERLASDAGPADDPGNRRWRLLKPPPIYYPAREAARGARDVRVVTSRRLAWHPTASNVVVSVILGRNNFTELVSRTTWRPWSPQRPTSPWTTAQTWMPLRAIAARLRCSSVCSWRRDLALHLHAPILTLRVFGTARVVPRSALVPGPGNVSLVAGPDWRGSYPGA